jgi:hypothetical protein
MANEFVAKNGLISQNNTTITGSLIQGLAGNIATGEYSHAEGSITKATGEYSHAEGDFTEASGNYSHAEGQNTMTLVSAQYSHAEGNNTIAAANYQHVQGQWNATSSIPAAFIVGNGTDNNNRSNLIYAHDSTVEITGSLAISASSGIPLQIKGGTGTLLSVSSSTSEIFKISDTFSPNLFTVSTGSITVFNIDNNKTVSISGSLVVTGSITGSLQGTASFATTASFALNAGGAGFPFTGNAVITGSLVVTGSTIVTGSLTTTGNVNGATPTELGYLSGVTSPIQTQLNNLGDISIEAYQFLGSQVKAQTIGASILNLSVNTAALQGATGGSTIRLIPVYLQTPQTISGITWFQNALGVYTPNNENKVGLYSYNGGTATLVASSSNDGNMWSGSYIPAASSYVTKSFAGGGSISASPGFYYIAMLMSFSAASTAPTFFASANMASNTVASRALDFTNGAALVAGRTTVASLPGSITVSTYTGVIQTNIWAAIY